MPKPPQPHALKVLKGTDRPDRSRGQGPAYPPPQSSDPPGWLTDPLALEYWHRIFPLLDGAGVLTAVDVEPLAHLCNLHGWLVKSWRAGELPKSATLTTYRQFLGSFGLTPGTRGAVAGAPRPVTDNPFSKILNGGDK
jgi:phage terminase small subunit